MDVSALDASALAVSFIPPRPVVLVSVGGKPAGNLFPMNLMGSLGGDRFAFALNRSRAAALAVRRHMRAALCNVPVEEAEAVRSLGPNHLRENIDWSNVPFELASSQCFGLPVPAGAVRVREVEVQGTQDVGSHTLFLARVVGDELRGDRLSFHVVHGHYQAWRLNQGLAPLR